jgi:ATP phosphoribosyltransferase
MSDPNCITIAAAKGYLWEEGQKILAKLGIVFDVDLSKSRKLFIYDTTKRYKILMVRSWDVPAYVEQGSADLGIVGKDVLLEQEPQVVELLDLGFGPCSLVLAGVGKVKLEDLPQNLNIATKYMQSTIKYFRGLGLKINPIKLYGAIELAPLTGLADYICDLTATGATLRENHLEIVDTIFTSTAILIGNKVSLRTRYDEIQALCGKISEVL